jgi:hypothetical protein
VAVVQQARSSEGARCEAPQASEGGSLVVDEGSGERVRAQLGKGDGCPGLVEDLQDGLGVRSRWAEEYAEPYGASQRGRQVRLDPRRLRCHRKPGHRRPARHTGALDRPPKTPHRQLGTVAAMSGEHPVSAGHRQGHQEARAVERRYDEVPGLVAAGDPAQPGLRRGRPQLGGLGRRRSPAAEAHGTARAGAADASCWSRTNRRLRSPTAIMTVNRGDSNES